MNYYHRHLGDYARKAGHLTMLEHGAYTLILDAYYEREQPLTKREAMRVARARSAEEKEAVENVLDDFFTPENPVGSGSVSSGSNLDTSGHVIYVQSRVEEELGAAKQRAEVARNNGKNGGRPRKQRKTNRKQTKNPMGSHLVIYGNPLAPQEKTNPIIHKSNTPHNPPRGFHGSGKAVGIDTFLTNCKSIDCKPVPEDDPVFDYAEESGIPTEFLRLCWAEFVQRNRESGKRYKDWRSAFRKCVRGRWYRLWWFTPEGEAKLTSDGQQAINKQQGGARAA